MDALQEITQKIEAQQERLQNALNAAESDSSKTAEVKALVETDIQPKLNLLLKDHEAAVQAEEVKGLRSTVESLTSVLSNLRQPSGALAIGNAAEPEGKADDNPYSTGEFSVFADIRLANKGNGDAIERLTKDLALPDDFRQSPEGKAMTEGTGSQGGYLVRAALERQIVLAKEQDNVLRQLCSKLNVNTNAISLDQIGIATSAGWVAELATKPESTSMTLATITANVFTAAGLATISNQLLQDSSPAVDGLVTNDLTKRLVALEEVAFLNGSGTGQPLGILQTPGLGTTSLTSTQVSATGGLLDSILDSITAVQTAYGEPSAILMHPRTWTRILKDKNAQGFYTIGSPVVTDARSTTPKTLFGVPVVTSNRIPTNLGTGTNESRVIVGDFGEALILDRQGITVDESPHVFFTTNQTVFRAETRVGFTAARTPLAFNVIGGVGLAAG